MNAARIKRLLIRIWLVCLFLLISFSFSFKSAYADEMTESPDSDDVTTAQNLENSSTQTPPLDEKIETYTDTIDNSEDTSNEISDTPEEVVEDSDTDSTASETCVENVTPDENNNTVEEAVTDSSQNNQEEIIDETEFTEISDEVESEDDTIEDTIIEDTSDEIVLASTKTVTPGITRISGATAYDTAMKVADELKKELNVEKFDTVLVATGQHYADSLSGSYLASVKSAPILLVTKETSKRSKVNEVYQYINNNLSEEGTIYILGGTRYMTKDIETDLNSLGRNLIRLARGGVTDTNLRILEEADPQGEDIIITTASSFPDALAASPLGKPIMLVNEELSDNQKAFLEERLGENNKLYIIGGTSSVKETTETALKEFGTVERIAGANRYLTAVEVANKFFPNTKEIALATGKVFQDAMVGGPYAEERGIPILLTSNDTSFHTAYKYVNSSQTIKSVKIIGGPVHISNDATGLDSAGKKKTGFLDIGSNKFYAESNGNLKKNTVFKVGSKYYGATANGTLAKNNWAKTGTLTYYFKNYEVQQICFTAKNVLDRIGYDLRKAYNWSASLPYYGFTSNPNWGSIWFANYGFQKLRGNCYVMASTFYIMAKMLGYDVTQVAGYVNTTIHRAAHSWTFIKHNGESWIYDPEFYNEHRILAFKIKNGQTRWYYNSDWTVMPM